MSMFGNLFSPEKKESLDKGLENTKEKFLLENLGKPLSESPPLMMKFSIIWKRFWSLPMLA